jgi:hypothetical protein
MEILLEGRTPIEVCMGILRGEFSEAFATATQDDRELQMSACHFLATHADRGDASVIAALTQKLRDDRAINEYVSLNEGYSGSDYFVSACAAEALRALGASVIRDDTPENVHEFWSFRTIEVNGDRLVLSQKRLRPSGMR